MSLLVSSGLMCAAAAGGVVGVPDDAATGRVIVTFAEGTRRPRAEAVLDARSMRFSRCFDHIARHCGRVIGTVSTADLGAVETMTRLRQMPGVVSVEPDHLRRVRAPGDDDPDFPEQWGLENTGQFVGGIPGTPGVDIGFQPAWELARESDEEIVIAVIDTGADVTHPDLAANIWVNPGEIADNGVDDDGNGYIDDVHGYDFVGDSPVVEDAGTHGTHIAGIIGAVGGNGTGVIGADFRAEVLPLKVSNDGDTLPTSATLEAMDYALALKADGVNLVAVNASYGGSSFVAAEKIAVEALWDAGIALCTAAGNEGADNDTTPSYPANYEVPNIITVAALDQSGGLPAFSNYGESTVDLAAPGMNIHSTLPLEALAVDTSLSVDTAVYQNQPVEYTGLTEVAGVSGTVHDCGIGEPGEFPPEVAGEIALIERGTLTFSAKEANAAAAGAAGVLIYDNTGDPLAEGAWTLGTSGDRLPVLRITRASGEAILADLPASGSMTLTRDESLAYGTIDGTSMATGYASAAVGFAARNFPHETVDERVARVLDHVTPVPALGGTTITGGRLSLLGIVDTDRDGLPDWWEAGYFGGLAETGAGDADGDGMTNRDEFLAATIPSGSVPVPAIRSISAGGDGPVRLTFPTVTGFDYRVEWSDSLEPGSWQILVDGVTGSGASERVEDVSGVDRRFYRLRVGE